MVPWDQGERNNRYWVAEMTNINILFNYFPEVHCATDVIFHHSDWPYGNVHKDRHYNSEKNHFFGLNTKVSVLPDVLAVGCTKAYQGSVSDIMIFRKRLALHRLWTGKDAGKDEDVEDFSELQSGYAQNWANSAQTLYSGLQYDICAIISKKTQGNRTLPSAYKSRNQNILRDRVLVEKTT